MLFTGFLALMLGFVCCAAAVEFDTDEDAAFEKELDKTWGSKPGMMPLSATDAEMRVIAAHNLAIVHYKTAVENGASRKDAKDLALSKVVGFLIGQSSD